MLITDDFLPVPVPESLDATYLVPIAGLPKVSPKTAVAALAGRLAEPVHGLAKQMLDSPLMTVDTRPIGEFPELPPDLLTAFGATEAQLARLAAATHLVVVQAEYRPGWPPAHEWAARAVAAAVAETVGSDVVDVFGLQFLDPAAALRSLPDEQGRIRLVDWVLVPYSSDADGLWFTTKGLRRFGLLELQAQGVPDHLTRAWGAVMTGAARRLLRDWTDGLAGEEVPAFVQLPVLATVTGHDIAVAYGNPEQHGATAPVLLRLELDPATDPDADSFLSLRPPPGHPGPAGRYFAAACATLFAGIQPDVRYARPGDAMSKAIATARAGLGDIRGRFLAGQLPAETQLVVKYGLPGDDGPEFVWAGVTSWDSAERIVGVSASDAATDPTVRIGAPVVIEATDVVDWALLDGTGVTEGGWTQAVLDAGERPQPD
ncbi:DUF2314 domain-containing protein [Micromonospora sp. 4G57]|uniref:DUF2314 domain-containing protein n=1 Tax=Micromonospora sicca TaxID=2202420 RepID=A0A317D4L7_9ACTN|nr:MULTISPECIES: DUF2314 domain-containing protein [unclassified Micromonospora]MDZ5446466.1 DUF2314 domain-containing protein [Micromonospora sp. 4G57]MDZ5493003.1 DUF2314 domain-containing protein [Micromonospora sp. 4G53]PWR07515.1 DUF2314 domain-containing protein [Micromonospora sp. 4G51]